MDSKKKEILYNLVYQIKQKQRNTFRYLISSCLKANDAFSDIPSAHIKIRIVSVGSFCAVLLVDGNYPAKLGDIVHDVSLEEGIECITFIPNGAGVFNPEYAGSMGSVVFFKGRVPTVNDAALVNALVKGFVKAGEVLSELAKNDPEDMDRVKFLPMSWLYGGFISQLLHSGETLWSSEND